MCALSRPATAQLAGALGTHDPSSLIKDGSTYYYFATGQGIVSRYSPDKITWSDGPAVFATPPAWTTQAVPSFTGFFWAPDVAYFNGACHLYYAVSSWGTIDSAIGVATSPLLTDPSWTDQGKVVQSDAASQAGPNTDTTAFNAIDPGILVDNATGKVWMSFGSYSSGILVTQLDPLTGKRLNASTLDATLVANNAPGGGWGSSIEGSALVKRGGYYYLFVNYGTCCSGIDSTYNIRVGRSTSPTGPFVDKNGVDMRNGGGSMFLDDDGKMIGPGHFAYYTEGGQDYFSYHYYNGDANGAPTYGLRNLYWTGDNWPTYAAVNPDWTGSTSGSWATSANWSGGTIPDGVGHVANFGSNTAGRYVVSLGAARSVSTVNFTGTASYTIGTTGHVLTLDAQAGDSATINVATGNHTLAAPLTAVDNLGVNVTPSDSTLTLAGITSAPVLTKYGHGTLLLGAATTVAGSVFVRAGTLDVTGSATAGQYVSIGAIAGEVGTMLVRQAGKFTAAADLNVGDTGDAATAATGTLEIRDNAAVTVNSPGGFYVGSGYFANTRATGTVNQSGGTLTANNAADATFVIGGRNSTVATGAYNLTGGTVNANTNVQVGGRGAGTVNQSAGTWTVAGYLSLGRFSSATGAWTIGGGTLTLTNASRSLTVGDAGTGTLTMSGTAQVSVAAPVRIGNTNTGVGILNLSGGTLTAPVITRGAGTATLNLNGGTLRAATGATTFLQGLTNAYVRAGGATVDTQAFAVTVAQPLLHDPSGQGTDGGLTKTGAGTLRLTGANTYSGRTTLNAGQLVLTPAATSVISSAGGAAVNAGRLVVDYAGSPTPAPTLVPLLNASGSGGFHAGQFTSATLDSYHTLGYLDDAPSSTFTVMRTYFGDLNLDGRVNADDYALLDRGFNKHLTGWSNGDVNYDGSVTSADYLLADASLAHQAAAPLSADFLAQREAQFGPDYVERLLAAVPEPGPAYTVALGIAVVGLRRQRSWGLQKSDPPSGRTAS